MRVFGIILIVAGILMLIVNGFSYKTEKEIVDIGPLEVNKKENKSVGWPNYVGALVTVAGVGVLLMARKEKNPR